MKLKMLITFKSNKAGETVTIDNDEQANWLISRKYATAAPEKKSAAKRN